MLSVGSHLPKPLTISSSHEWEDGETGKWGRERLSACSHDSDNVDDMVVCFSGHGVFSELLSPFMGISWIPETWSL